MNTIGQVAIYNQALAAVGISKFVQLMSEGSPQANVCNLFWQSCQDQILEDASPAFATRYTQLAKSTKLVYGWKNVFAYPADCLILKGLVDQPVANSTPTTEPLYYQYKYLYNLQVPYGVSEDEVNGGLAIGTDADFPIAQYTARVTNLALWPASIINALVLLLATKIVAPLAANPKYAETAGRAYEFALNKAIANGYNEATTVPDLDSEFVTTRG